MRAPTKMAVGQVSVSGSTATLVVAARESRVKLRLNLTGQVALGSDSSVTSTTGYKAVANVNGEVELETGSAVYAIGISGGTSLSFLETYD